MVEKNNLIQFFNHAFTRIQNDNYIAVIKDDQVPVGENASAINEIYIVMISDH